MKKILLIAVVALGMITVSNAQDYSTGIGLRGGLYNGVTLKHFISDEAALEGILSTRWSGFKITGLYEKHQSFFTVDRMYWYYGFGGHVGFWNGNDVDWADDNDSYTVIGIDGILGLEYNFDIIPINISLDWKPAFNLVGHSGFWGDGGALSVRYIF